jgi:hypothetical protein
MKPKSKPMFVVSMYRPPNSSIVLFEKIETLFQNLDNEREELILVGNLNCDFIKTAANNQTKRLIDLINVFQLTQLIKEPTRITDSGGNLGGAAAPPPPPPPPPLMEKFRIFGNFDLKEG